MNLTILASSGGGVTLLLALLLFCNTSFAQCPAAGDIPPTIAWTPATAPAIVILSPTCTLTVTYCTRTLTNTPGPGQSTLQTYITGWNESGGNCNGVLLWTKVRAINIRIAQIEGTQTGCDPYNTMVQITSACWKDQGGGAFTPCGAGRCLKSYQYCYENGQHVVKGPISYAVEGTVDCSGTNCASYTCGDNP